MRTTLNLDDDVLQAARALSQQRGQPIGAVISELARRSLSPPAPEVMRNGIRLFPVRAGAGPVTPDIVKQLLDETD